MYIHYSILPLLVKSQSQRGVPRFPGNEDSQRGTSCRGPHGSQGSQGDGPGKLRQNGFIQPMNDGHIWKIYGKL